MKNFNAESCNEKKAIIIGASSGMGREIAKLLSKEGYTLGLIARRKPLLESLQKELEVSSYIQQLDVTDSNANIILNKLITTMQGLDLIVISISAYLDNRNSTSSDEAWKRTIDVDCKGFIAMAETALAYFKEQNHGHIIGISSTSGLFGTASNPIYSGAKACISYYMQGLHREMRRDRYDIYITNIVPGFVAVEHSPLGTDPTAYWEITAQEAGKLILEGIKQKRKIVYLPSKVWLLNLIKFLPDFIYERFFNFF